MIDYAALFCCSGSATHFSALGLQERDVNATSSRRGEIPRVCDWEESRFRRFPQIKFCVRNRFTLLCVFRGTSTQVWSEVMRPYIRAAQPDDGEAERWIEGMKQRHSQSLRIVFLNLLDPLQPLFCPPASLNRFLSVSLGSC